MVVYREFTVRFCQVLQRLMCGFAEVDWGCEGHSSNTFGILLGYFWDTFGILLGYFWDTFGILLGYFWLFCHPSFEDTFHYVLPLCLPVDHRHTLRLTVIFPACLPCPAIAVSHTLTAGPIHLLSWLRHCTVNSHFSPLLNSGAYTHTTQVYTQQHSTAFLWYTRLLNSGAIQLYTIL